MNAEGTPEVVGCYLGCTTMSRQAQLLLASMPICGLRAIASLLKACHLIFGAPEHK
jgi:hypothetical protein